MTETVTLDVVPLGEPAHADVLVAVRGEDVPLVGGERERCQQGCVSENERASGGVFVCG